MKKLVKLSVAQRRVSTFADLSRRDTDTQNVVNTSDPPEGAGGGEEGSSGGCAGAAPTGDCCPALRPLLAEHHSEWLIADQSHMGLPSWQRSNVTFGSGSMALKNTLVGEADGLPYYSGALTYYNHVFEGRYPHEITFGLQWQVLGTNNTAELTAFLNQVWAYDPPNLSVFGVYYDDIEFAYDPFDVEGSGDGEIVTARGPYTAVFQGAQHVTSLDFPGVGGVRVCRGNAVGSSGASTCDGNNDPDPSLAGAPSYFTEGVQYRVRVLTTLGSTYLRVWEEAETEPTEWTMWVCAPDEPPCLEPPGSLYAVLGFQLSNGGHSLGEESFPSTIAITDLDVRPATAALIGGQGCDCDSEQAGEPGYYENTLIAQDDGTYKAPHTNVSYFEDVWKDGLVMMPETHYTTSGNTVTPTSDWGDAVVVGRYVIR